MFTVSVNDYGYYITDTLENADGSAFNLEGYTIKFHIWKQYTPGTLLVEGNADIVNSPGTDGKVRYLVAVGNFKTIGTFMGEWEATRLNIKQSFPTSGFIIQVEESA